MARHSALADLNEIKELIRLGGCFQKFLKILGCSLGELKAMDEDLDKEEVMQIVTDLKEDYEDIFDEYL